MIQNKNQTAGDAGKWGRDFTDAKGTKKQEFSTAEGAAESGREGRLLNRAKTGLTNNLPSGGVEAVFHTLRLNKS